MSKRKKKSLILFLSTKELEYKKVEMELSWKLNSHQEQQNIKSFFSFKSSQCEAAENWMRKSKNGEKEREKCFIWDN